MLSRTKLICLVLSDSDLLALKALSAEFNVFSHGWRNESSTREFVFDSFTNTPKKCKISTREFHTKVSVLTSNQA